MGEFVEPEFDVDDQPLPKVFTQEFFNKVIANAVNKGEISSDDRLVFIAATDETGVKAVVAVNLLKKENISVKINGIFEHDWGGDNKAGAKVIFSLK